MNNQELSLLLHHISGVTARLNQFQYETILLCSTILYRFGNSVRFSQAKL